jgi:hypothetical protein
MNDPAIYRPDVITAGALATLEDWSSMARGAFYTEYAMASKFALMFIYAFLLCGCRSPQPGGTPREFGSCTLTQPPAEAGEMGSHGLEMRVYPRAKTIKSEFTGCQTIWWIAKSGRMQITSRARFEQGSIAELTEFDDDTGAKKVLVCRYARAELESVEDGCPTFESVNRPAESFPPGCLEKTRSSEGRGPQPCVDDFDFRAGMGTPRT